MCLASPANLALCSDERVPSVSLSRKGVNFSRGSLAVGYIYVAGNFGFVFGGVAHV